MKNFLQRIKENRQVTDVVAILIVALILAIPIFYQNNNLYFDDGSQHLMRAYHTYKAILQNGSGKVISSFTNGFGYSWDLFYGPLSADLIMFFGILFRSFNLGFKIGMLFLLFLAGFFMYRFILEMMDNRNTACLAGIIYMTSPYFFTDVYVRHAMR